jgi:hypothetical protein
LEKLPGICTLFLKIAEDDNLTALVVHKPSPKRLFICLSQTEQQNTMRMQIVIEAAPLISTTKMGPTVQFGTNQLTWPQDLFL